MNYPYLSLRHLSLNACDNHWMLIIVGTNFVPEAHYQIVGLSAFGVAFK